MRKEKIDLIIILDDLTAEGCPILALNLIDELRKNKKNILVLRFKDFNNELLEEFNKRKIKIISYQLANTGLLRYLKIIFKTFYICKNHNPFSILCFPFGWHSFVAFSAKLAGVNNFCVHAGNLAPDSTKKDYLKFKLLTKFGEPFTNKIICCSKYIENSIICNLGINPIKISCIYNSYDEKKFKFKEEFSLKNKVNSGSEIIIGMVGRFEEHKDQKSLIESIKLLKQKNYNIKLFLVGDGSNKELLVKIVKKLDLEQNVNFLGYQININEILNSFDIFVFSTTEYEGFGIAMVEAMGKGLPIIASDVGSCNEILSEGRFGILVKKNSPQSIAKSIVKIISNIEDTNTRRKAAYLHANKNFSRGKMAKSYLSELGFKI